MQGGRQRGGPQNQHGPWRDPCDPRRDHVPEAPADPVAHHRTTHRSRHDEAHAGLRAHRHARGLTQSSRSGPQIADQPGLTDTTPITDHGGEVRRTPKPMGDRKHARPQAESCSRPLARRAARIARPARVRMRSRKPCVLARRRLLGWKVRLLTDRSWEGAGTSRSGLGLLGRSTCTTGGRSRRAPPATPMRCRGRRAHHLSSTRVGAHPGRIRLAPLEPGRARRSTPTDVLTTIGHTPQGAYRKRGRQAGSSRPEPPRRGIPGRSPGGQDEQARLWTSS